MRPEPPPRALRVTRQERLALQLAQRWQAMHWSLSPLWWWQALGWALERALQWMQKPMLRQG